MVAFSLETLLLLTVAYFLGCILSCILRRSIHRPAYQHQAAGERRVDPLPEVLARGNAPVRFDGTPVPAAPTPAAQPHIPAATAPASPPPAAVVARAPAPANPGAVPVPAPAVAPAQDLKRVRLIDDRTETTLNELGITRYAQIAAWTRDDVRRITEALGTKGRINQENWIEQAALLAKGGETHYAARRARGETATVAPTPDSANRGAPPLETATWPRAMSRGGVAATVVAPVHPAVATPAPASSVSAAPPLVSERAAFARMRTASAPAAVPIRPATVADDNLQRIGNITPQIEKALAADGITRYAQIAQWSPADVERYERQLVLSGGISRENWVEQAQILSRGGDTRYSRQFDAQMGIPQVPPSETGTARRTELANLRSVRSPAFRNAVEPGPEAAERAMAQSKIPRASDDLKRIRGIGVLIEKRLNAMGVTGYDQMANWTAADIDRVSRTLDFKGRIERENWVEQARILSAGGQTEFSRRVDRGEVESSRTKA